MLIMNFIVGKPSRYCFNQALTMNITTVRANPPNLKH